MFNVFTWRVHKLKQRTNLILNDVYYTSLVVSLLVHKMGEGEGALIRGGALFREYTVYHMIPCMKRWQISKPRTFWPYHNLLNDIIKMAPVHPRDNDKSFRNFRKKHWYFTVNWVTFNLEITCSITFTGQDVAPVMPTCKIKESRSKSTHARLFPHVIFDISKFPLGYE